MTVPYGLRAAAPLPGSFSPDMSGVAFCNARQVSMVGGAPVVEQPHLLGAWAKTWGENGDTQ
ncbi:MAG: hypothetical protein JWO67_7210 [Streptosporangiaceae bacterium]|nr:hypothetical protein [Streptosporangiaceae bacterium]